MKDFPIAQKITKVGNTAFDVQLPCKKEWEREVYSCLSLLSMLEGFLQGF